ncbi:MAG TPA: 2-oxo acid dehydrogenase subunit E2 [Candidatus Marinimicrobia bacterium]|nr:2-oxo acid dehydrogenase subunit E2 [Candidatus Neomarinimicrobiota bacterium]
MIFEFKFPDVGEGVHEGKVLQLKYKAGDMVEAGEILAVIETDKVVAEIPSPKSGKLQKYGAEEGQIINVGEVLAFLEVDGDAPAKEVVEEENAGVVGELEVATGDSFMPASGEGFIDGAAEDSTLDDRQAKVIATPVARKMASDLGIRLDSIKGSGPGGRIMKEDILRAKTSGEIESKPASKSEAKAEKAPESLKSKMPAIETAPVSASSTSIPLSTMRQTIARNMEESNRIPAAVIQDFTIVDALVKLRERLNEGREGADRLSFQPFFIKALAAALKAFPQLNATYDAAKSEVTAYKEINVGLAVDTEVGLMVPVIRNVESKSIAAINREMRSLVEAAQKRTIALNDLRGGTISITNYGAFGGVYGVPMINPPQVAILGIGRMHQAPVVKNGEIVPAWVLPVSLPFDHRVIDGALASKFVTRFLNLLHNPDDLLISM